MEVTDLDALQEALELAAADGTRWRSWRDNGLEAVSRSYSWDAHVCSYLGHGQRHCLKPAPAPMPAPSVASPLPERLLVLDLDVALEAPDPAGLEELRRRLAADSGSGLGLLSGRGFKAARLRYGELHLPEPRVWIVQAGSEIRYGPEGSQDLAWQDHIARGWQRRAVEEALAGLAPRLELQAEAQQGAFKVSYMLRPPPAGVLEMVHRRLRQRQLAARAHLFNHWYLDVLPVRASKAEAIRHLARRWQLPLEQILVVAAQQGDGELLSGPGPGVVVGAHAAVSEGLHPRRRKLFFASRPQAWGVLEGIDHHRFLRR